MIRTRARIGTFALLISASLLGACGGATETSEVPHPTGDTKTDSGTAKDAGKDSAEAGCRTDNDCPNVAGGQLCIGPNGPAEIAACSNSPTCTNDSTCDGGVCETSAVAGSLTQCGGESGAYCQAPCQSDDECNYWAECNPTGHCVARTCDKCPSYLSCSSGECAATSCSGDKDCPGGYCVDDTCMGTLGYCGGPYG